MTFFQTSVQHRKRPNRRKSMVPLKSSCCDSCVNLQGSTVSGPISHRDAVKLTKICEKFPVHSTIKTPKPWVFLGHRLPDCPDSVWKNHRTADWGPGGGPTVLLLCISDCSLFSSVSFSNMSARSRFS